MKTFYKREAQKSLWKYIPISVLIGTCCAMGSCSKTEDDFGKVDDIKVSVTSDLTDMVYSVELEASGGKDTLYVYSQSDLKAAFETDEIQNWVKVEKIEPISNSTTYRVIVDVLPMEDSFKKRIGVLNFSNSSPLSGAFIRLWQGYDLRIDESFSWLKFGTGTPLDLSKATAIGQWSAAQKLYGWTTANTGTTSFTYGMNGYVLLGNALAGGSLSSPITPGVEKDSLLLLTFNAVSYTTAEGEKDNTKLTVKLVGAEFEDSKTSRLVEVTSYDHQSALLLNNMWDASLFTFVLKKPVLNPASSTVQIQFFNGDQTESAGNRIFIDNIKLYSTDQFIAVKK